jgi:hypothetical protein
MEALFRQLTPLVLLAVVVAVVLEPWFSEVAWIREHLGSAVLLRGCVAVLGCYVLLLWGESIRLHTILTGVLQAFRQFDARGGKDAAAARNPKTRLEAARLLIAALKSEDPEIRASSRANLARLVGNDLGADPAAWQKWLADQERTLPS